MMLVAVAAMTLSMTAVAHAHPHVLPTVRTDLKFNPAGHVTAIQYTWLYDSAYSTFAGRDIDADKDGTISAGELAAFAKSQIDTFGGSKKVCDDGKRRTLYISKKKSLAALRNYPAMNFSNF